ncbi:MAG: isoprenylcysteine carboxylmethyltransferase family protein [Anaerolineales bacterium]|nr:isoprenylcysteine carboxylmethyltransferase family protein [Anaerolineales bacterium]
MTLFPPLSLGWFNGWIPIVLFYGIFLAVLKIFPKDTVDRLYEDSGWTLEQARPAKIGLPFALAAMVLIIFTPLKINRSIFWTGLATALIGQSEFLYSLHTFNVTPLGEPVTAGLYKISRNPQWVTFAVVMVGFSLMAGSWTVLALLAVRVVMNHFRILGEEQALEDQYGESYRSYKESVPRYFIFF